MTYVLNYNGEKLKLNDYKPKIAKCFDSFYKEMSDEKLDMVKRINSGLCAVVVALGENKTKKIYPNFEDVDVNDVMILVEQIRDVYNHPLSEYRSKRVINSIEKAIKNIKDNGSKNAAEASVKPLSSSEYNNIREGIKVAQNAQQPSNFEYNKLDKLND